METAKSHMIRLTALFKNPGADFCKGEMDFISPEDNHDAQFGPLEPGVIGAEFPGVEGV